MTLLSYEMTLSLFISLSIASAFRQAESEEKSESIKWGILNQYKKNNKKIINRKCYGYGKDKKGNLVIKENEAEVVRKIFKLYIDGHSLLDISDYLYEHNILSPRGNTVWSKKSIDKLLLNEKYTGNIRLYKTYTGKYPMSIRHINRGEKPQYHIDGNHTPIIDKNIFEKAIKCRERRGKFIYDDDWVTKEEIDRK